METVKIRVKAGDREYDVEVERQDAIFRVTVDGVPRLVDARKLEADFYSILTDGRSFEISVERETASLYHARHGATQRTVVLTDATRRGRENLEAAGHGPLAVVSVMPGRIARVLVALGDEVTEGQGLVVVEAMKMENEIGAPRAGRVAAVHVEAGRAVEAGTTLVVLE
jgi:biotin carboxyl carrier protein